MTWAPIALFTYNRPEHTRRTVEALIANEGANKSHLFIFSDAPRAPSADPAVAEVRAYLRAINGFGQITIIERETNFGLARSVSDGVTRICNQYSRVIVVEDDILTSRFFLDFMNRALDRYADEPRVMHISAYMFPVQQPERLPETFLFRGASCWGWATWHRAWLHYNENGKALLQGIRTRGLQNAFNYEGMRDFTGMLEQQIAGRVDSWAIRWYASVFLAGGLCLHPARSLVNNIGTDGSGIHCGVTDVFSNTILDSRVRSFAEENEESPQAVAAVKEFFASLEISFAKRVIRRIRRLMANPKGSAAKSTAKPP